jgi:hypothetical protein
MEIILQDALLAPRFHRHGVMYHRLPACIESPTNFAFGVQPIRKSSSSQTTRTNRRRRSIQAGSLCYFVFSDWRARYGNHPAEGLLVPRFHRHGGVVTNQLRFWCSANPEVIVLANNANRPSSPSDTGWKPMLLCFSDWRARYGNHPAEGLLVPGCIATAYDRDP